MTQKREIRITGKGQIRVRPDMIRLRITLERTLPDYDMTLQCSSKDTGALRELLLEHGFKHEDLKTLRFDINTEYESYRDKDGNYQRQFVGYKYEHIMRLEFEIDNERLGKLLYALGKSDLRPVFELGYTVKDPEAAKNELLGKAVQDAKSKALTLTAAAGVMLCQIQNIDYSWGEIDIEVHPVKHMMVESRMMANPDSYDMDIEPDDVELTDTVTVTWEIA